MTVCKRIQEGGNLPSIAAMHRLFTVVVHCLPASDLADVPDLPSPTAPASRVPLALVRALPLPPG